MSAKKSLTEFIGESILIKDNSDDAGYWEVFFCGLPVNLDCSTEDIADEYAGLLRDNIKRLFERWELHK